MKSFIVKVANLIGETGLYRFLFPTCVPVFMLHRVVEDTKDIPGAMSAETLRSYLRYLADRGFHVLTMEQLWQFVSQGEVMPSKSVLFTIDDGFYDHHDVAAKVFDEFGFALNFFVITGLLDEKLWPWDDQISYGLSRTSIRQADIELPSGRMFKVNLEGNTPKEITRMIRDTLKADDQTHLYDWIEKELFEKLGVERPSNIPIEYRPMSWDDARSLKRRGHGIFPHTITHRILSRLSLEEKRYEIIESQSRVNEELGVSSDVFAYPTGQPSDFDSSDLTVLQEAGFRMAFSTVASYVKKEAKGDVYAIPRFSLPETKHDFLQIVNRFELLKDALKSG